MKVNSMNICKTRFAWHDQNAKITHVSIQANELLSDLIAAGATFYTYGGEEVMFLGGEVIDIYRKQELLSALARYLNVSDLSYANDVAISLRNQAKMDDPGLCALVRVLKSSSSFAEVNVLPALVHVDPSACLNKIRVLAEKLVKLIIAKQELRPRQSTFAGCIETLQHAQLLSQRSVGYLNTVRVIGNLASHPSGEDLAVVDVRIAAFALASAAEESLNKRLL